MREGQDEGGTGERIQEAGLRVVERMVDRVVEKLVERERERGGWERGKGWW